jgi:hypothetical protein
MLAPATESGERGATGEHEEDRDRRHDVCVGQLAAGGLHGVPSDRGREEESRDSFSVREALVQRKESRPSPGSSPAARLRDLGR